MTKTRLLQAVAVALAATLGGCGDAVRGPDYPGVPLATLGGNITTGTNVTVPNPVRLALAWYPFSGAASQQPPAPLTQPKSILTQDVLYRGSFPLSFTFDVYAPPPADAMSDYSAGGGAQRVATGLLIAYEDRNGNGRLDTIPENGSPIDNVLGASAAMGSSDLGPDYVQTLMQYSVLYIEGAIPADNFGIPGQALVPGFNLVRVAPDGSGEVIPTTTPIGIELANDPLLNLLVCDAMFDLSALYTGEVCGIHIADTSHLHVHASVDLTDGVASASVNVSLISDQETPVSDAVVQLGATTLALDPRSGSYGVTDTTGSLVTAGGQYTITVAVPGKKPERFEFTMPEKFDIVSPAASAQLPAEQEFTVSVTESPGARVYMVYVGAALDMMESAGLIASDLENPSPLDLSTTVPGLCAGPGFVRVRAIVHPDGAPVQTSLAFTNRVEFK